MIGIEQHDVRPCGRRRISTRVIGHQGPLRARRPDVAIVNAFVGGDPFLEFSAVATLCSKAAMRSAGIMVGPVSDRGKAIGPPAQH